MPLVFLPHSCLSNIAQKPRSFAAPSVDFRFLFFTLDFALMAPLRKRERECAVLLERTKSEKKEEKEGAPSPFFKFAQAHLSFIAKIAEENTLYKLYAVPSEDMHYP